MARNKYPEETIKQILDVSFKLFMEKGYEQTTIQDIVNRLGMSKGAIYHHFKSKEEIVDSICEKHVIGSDAFAYLKQNPTLTGLEKIRKAFIDNLLDTKKQQLDYIMVSFTNNPKFVVKHLSITVDIIAPIIAQFIEEGIQDGSIQTPSSKWASETLMLLINTWLNPSVFHVSQEEFLEKLNFFETLTTQMGIPFIDHEFKSCCIQYYEKIFIAHP